ncbi:MAG TPA: polysaccharide deacetylase family protein [Pseudolabrys sp.]|nr:polysaccharide deacetylase family protein [Pseudolabrys sp.]
MRGVVLLIFWLVGVPAAFAEPCPGNPDALGTSRVLTIAPSEFQRIGSMQYAQTLPLADHEVVITFDDGPIPPYSSAILDILASQCVKVTYFLVGEMAQTYPSIVRRMYNAGHSIGSHSQNHPYRFQGLSPQNAEQQVDRGIASVDTALGDPKALSPFFRFPGLGRTSTIEGYLASKSLVTWSADIVADDWKHIGAKEIVKRAMRRLDERGRGILLLHDIHPATVLALPMLLKELKEHGYRIVQVVAAGERPASLPEPVASPDTNKEAWPRVVHTKTTDDKPPQKALRHRAKKAITGKHRRPTMASLHEPDYTAYATDWRQGQF